MDLVADYGSEGGSSSDDEKKEDSIAPLLKASFVAPRVNAAPNVLSQGVQARAVTNPLQASAFPMALVNKSGGGGGGQIMVHNPKADAFLAPMQGPAHPHRRDLPVPAGGRATGTGGVIEQASMEEFSFHEQYHTFHQFGYAVDQTGQMVGDIAAHSKRQGDTVLSAGVGDLRRKRRKDAKEDTTGVGAGEKGALLDVGDADTDGVWAPDRTTKAKTDFEAGTMTEAQKKFREEWEAEEAKKHREYNMEEDHDRRDERKISHLLPPRHNRDTTAAVTKSTFHGKSLQDYQGRSWMAPPAGAREGDGEHKCFTPKKCIHRWTGHTKGVQAISFFPGYGHLLLSASMDGTVKMWDVNGGRGQRRTYHGHTAAVRDIAFSNDGHKFLSAGYDRFVRLWDAESGKCVTTFTNRKMPYSVTYYPVDNNIFLAGCSDNRVVQYDARSGEIVQEYNHHLGPVNSVLFVDDDQRFVSTSDDKKVLIWEYNIPVPIKYISEPEMHSMPTTAMHPSGGFWVGQSLDNKIVTWTGRDKFRQMRKKVFKGHVNAGYACRMTFSPNGKFLASGDGQGKMYIWDWGSTKVYRKLQVGVIFGKRVGGCGEWAGGASENVSRAVLLIFKMDKGGFIVQPALYYFCLLVACRVTMW
ncbi:unnamed protein product [Choristocarpus tenellus]